MIKNYRFYYYLSLFCILQYILTTSVLFYFYEGASRYNINHNNYLFFDNFLSDLGRVVGFNGNYNVTSLFYATTLSIIGVGTLSFFWYINQFFKGFKFANYGVFIGVISGISLALVGIFAVDENKVLHLTFLAVGYLLFFITFLGYNRLMLKQKGVFKGVLPLASALSLGLFFYILILMFGGNPDDNENSLFLQVVSQKVIVYGQLIILATILIKLPPKSLNYISNK